MTAETIQKACTDSGPLWARYPVLPPYGRASTPDESVSARARVDLRFKEILAQTAASRARGEDPVRPRSQGETIYRSMDRYLRRHVAPHVHALLIRWINSGDPMLIGREIWGSAQAQAAWAYLLWIFTIEPTVQGRRFRMTDLVTAVHGRGVVFHAESLAGAFALDRTDARRIHDSAPLAGAALLQIWHAAVQAARSMAARRLAHWGPGTLRFDPHAAGVDAQFLEERPKDLLGASSRPARQERLQQRADEAARRNQQLENFFEGPCLLFDGTDWKTSSDVKTDRPAALDFIRARLFSVQGRPKVILRQSSDGWLARLVDQPIQVFGNSKTMCFTLLREACRQFIKSNPSRWNTQAQIDPGKPVRITSLLEYTRRACVNQFGIDTGEFGWILEDNKGMLSIAELPGARVNHRYRIFEKTL